MGTIIFKTKIFFENYWLKYYRIYLIKKHVIFTSLLSKLELLTQNTFDSCSLNILYRDKNKWKYPFSSGRVLV